MLNSLIDISALTKGNKSAYEAVYMEFYDVLYNLSFQYLNSKYQAEEIVQEAFLKLWEVRETINENTNIRNFLYTIVKNNSLNAIRNKQTALKHHDIIKHKELELQYKSLNRLGDELMIAEELQLKIDAAINKLPEKICRVFIMSRYEEMKYNEIAEKLQISPKTVEARISKALSILRLELKDYLILFPLLLKIFS